MTYKEYSIKFSHIFVIGVSREEKDYGKSHMCRNNVGSSLVLFFFFLSFFLRKISPELTSATKPPLYAEEAWP